MTNLNKLIKQQQGEEDWAEDFRKEFDSLGLKQPKNSIKNAERELIIYYIRNLLDQTHQQTIADVVRIARKTHDEMWGRHDRTDFYTDSYCEALTDVIEAIKK
jgi:hypothetical protein